MLSRSNDLKEPAARLGLKYLCKLQHRYRPSHDLTLAFWDDVCSIWKRYGKTSTKVFLTSQEVRLEIDLLFDKHGPKLWKRALVEDPVHDWLFRPGEVCRPALISKGHALMK
jgi:hypothetical protein